MTEMNGRRDWGGWAALAELRGEPQPGYCAWCHEELKGRRRRWCSDECSAAASWVLIGGYRGFAKARDQGICAQCGLDTNALKERLRRFTRLSGKRWERARRVLVKKGYELGRSFWVADHIVPLALGGANVPSNIQTLCVPCNKQKTAEDVRRIARDRVAAPRFTFNLRLAQQRDLFTGVAVCAVER